MSNDTTRLSGLVGAEVVGVDLDADDFLLDLHGTNHTRARISGLLTRFYESAAASSSPEMERSATTISSWWPQILAGITAGITNAASEGINRAIKIDARCA